MAVVASVGELLGIRGEVAVPGNGGGRVVGSVNVVGVQRSLTGRAGGSGLDNLGLGNLGGSLGLLDDGLGLGLRLGLRLRLGFGLGLRLGLGSGLLGNGGGLRDRGGGGLGLADVLEDNESLVGGLCGEVGGGRTVGIDVSSDGLDLKLGDKDTLVNGAGGSEHGAGQGKGESGLHREW